MKLLFRCKLWLYPAKIKTHIHTKIISLFKHCFDFFPIDFLINIVFYWTEYNQIYIIIPSYKKN